MGIVCNKGKKREETLIQNQIKLAVQEDEQIKISDNIKQIESDKVELVEEEVQQPQHQNQSESKHGIEIQSEVEGKEKQKSKHVKKKSTLKKDDNYLKMIEYSDIKIQSYILQSKLENQINHFQLTINFLYQDYQYSVNCQAIVQYETSKPFFLTPITFNEAAQNSNYAPFFIQDTYFNIDLQLNSNLQSFNQLLEIKRNSILDKLEEDSALLLTRRQSKITGAQTPTPKKTKKKKKRGYLEMMEMIHLFDLECSPRLNQLLFAVALQNYSHEISKHLININDVFFLFNEKPSLDRQEIHRVLIFYEHFDYNLLELSDHLLKNQLTLSYQAHVQLSISLLEILQSCYSQYFYRLNFTLKTIFWVGRQKSFKLSAFGRIQTLLIMDGKDNQNKYKNICEEKVKVFQRDFQKDFGAVLDLILYFKLLDKDIPTIKKQRRKKKCLGENETYYQKYLCLYDQAFCENQDIMFQGLARLKFYENNTLEQILDEIKQFILTLKQLLSKFEKKQEEKQENTEIIKSLSLIDEIYSDSERVTQLYSFNEPIQKNKNSQLSEEQSLYYQMLYSSLFYSQNFNIICDQFMAVAKNQLSIAYTQIHYSIWKKLNSVKKEGFCLEQQITLQNIAKSLAKQNYSQDSFNYYLLLELLTQIKEKPLNLLHNLKTLVCEQNNRRRKQIKPKLSSNQKFNGIVEMRKAIILDVFYIDYFVSAHEYNKALQMMQQSIQQQLKFNLKQYLLYSQSLFINGLLNEKTLQTVSAMLNLEIAKIRYDEFFPNSQRIYIDDDTQKIVSLEQQEGDKSYTPQTIYFDNQGCENMNVLDFHLGKVYFSLHDKENALKCLRRVKQARQKKFDILSDEVIEVIIEILKILVEQEDSGAAGEICYEYKEKFRDYYKKNFYFKSRYVARLQLIMAAIFECNGMIITSLRYYQRANRTFNQSKTNSYILQIHIRNKIFKLISNIKTKAQQICSLGRGQLYNLDLQFSYRVGYLSEQVKPYFNNQFLRKSLEEKATFYKPIVFGYLINIYSMFRHQESEKFQKKLEKLSSALKKRKVDECYGFTLEKQGLQSIIQKKYSDAIKYLLLAIEIHERFLIFPNKDYSIFNCQVLILCCFCQLQKKQEMLDQLNLVDQFITEFYDTLKWNSIPHQRKSNKFMTLVNKLGQSSIYFLFKLDKKIEKFQKMRYKLIQNLQNQEKQKKITNKYLELKIRRIHQQNIKEKSIYYKRQLCIQGKLCKIKIIQNKSVKIVDQQIKSLVDFDNVETQKSTQPNLQNHYQINKDRTISILVTSTSTKQPVQSQNELFANQKSQISEENLETCRNKQELLKTNLLKDKSKCSTNFTSQVLKTVVQISDQCSQASKKNSGKQNKQIKLDPFQKTKRK